MQIHENGNIIVVERKKGTADMYYASFGLLALVIHLIINFNILKRLTNKIILCNDNDKAGLESLEKIKKNVKFSHMYFSNLKNPKELKDAGDMIDLLRTNNKTCYNINDNYYRLSFSNT